MQFRVWSILGWQEVRQRYRRSILGPFWLTLSTGVMIIAMGPLYGRLLGQDVSSYLPYLAVSLVLWQLLANLTTESRQAFIAAEPYIKNLKLPLLVHVLRVIWRNLIIFAHNLLIVVIVYAIAAPAMGWHVLRFPLALGVLLTNALWLGLFLGLLCARFRDIPQILPALFKSHSFLLRCSGRPKCWAEMRGPRSITRFSTFSKWCDNRCWGNRRAPCRGLWSPQSRSSAGRLRLPSLHGSARA